MSKNIFYILSRRIVCILLLVICAHQLWALPEPESDSISRFCTLDEVTIVAKKQIVVIPAQSLDGERLQELSAHSVADAMRYFSGVQIKDFGGVGGIKTVDIRSMGSHHVGVFYDGIEVGNAQNGTVDLGKFSLENIESVSLYNGQKTESLQSAKDFGSAGTIYIRTRIPTFEHGKKYNVIVGVKAGSFGLANPSLLYEQKLSESVSLNMNVEYTYATGRYPFTIKKYLPDGSLAWDTTGYRQNGDINAFRAEAGLFGYLPHGKWHIKGYYYQSNKGIPRAIIRNVWTSSQRQWDRNAFVQGAFQYRVGRRWEMQISA
ncbi:MAG: TonB-dependent receptor plug domain-containing protein, partial [Paludibacteraceae bacterium]|nr:TonB-dependent receptor plug domain-containing protein [Paludibacteraceae bacterium]